MEAVTGAFVLAGVAVSFGVSASAGLGGSLVLMPTLALVLGAKEGIALAALLLAGNNVVKVVAYRDSLPFRKAAWIVAGIGVGAIFGAGLLVAVPEDVVALAVIASFSLAILLERLPAVERARQTYAPVLSIASGATSGFSGTSGPLKGVAVRSLGLDRLNTVGCWKLRPTWSRSVFGMRGCGVRTAPELVSRA